MLGLRVATQDINREKFAWVPDIRNYSKIWSDKELKKKFKLSKDQMDYIKSKIISIE
jgi:hypothetical protein